MHSPSGIQYELNATFDGVPSQAIITELAASLRALSVGGVRLVQGYAEHESPPAGSGIVLVPWPNRVDGGRWELDGKVQQLDITEVPFGNASHGLLRNTAYRLVERGADFVTLEAPILPQHGYPFIVDTAVTYRLVPGGLAVTHVLTNHSERTAPVALGTHPYFRIGETPTEDLVLSATVGTVFETNERLIPVAEVPVAGGELAAVQTGVRIGDIDLNHGFGGVATPGQRSAHTLTDPAGRVLTVWADDAFDYVQLYINTAYATPDGPVIAIAIEPMTAPTNALATGQGLRWLEPGETWTLDWGVAFTF